MKTLLILSLILYPFAFSFAHPGGTDKDGCHKVSKDYKYTTSKKVLKAGTEHCHAGLDKMKFDGKQVLEDPPAKKEKGKK